MTSIFRRKNRAGFCLKYKDPASGRWRMRTFKTRTAAQGVADRLKAGGAVAGQLFKMHAMGWLERAALTVRPSTATGYGHELDNHLLPAFGHLGLEAITRFAIRDFLTAKLRSGLSVGTVRNLRGTLRVCLQEALEDGQLAVNPAAGRFRLLATDKNKSQSRIAVKAFDHDQLGRFLKAATKVLSRDRYALFLTMALTGMRSGEALGLQWDDVDLEGGTALIRRGISRRRIQPTKTGAERTVDLAAALCEELKAHDARTKAIALQRGKERAAWVFPSTVGTPTDYKFLPLDFRKATSSAGLPPHHTPHSLRHTYASLMLSSGKSVYYVQRQLGHAAISLTTDLYGRWLPAGDRAAADWLADSVLSPSLVTTGKKQGSKG